jgi:hypothetical protein
VIWESHKEFAATLAQNRKASGSGYTVGEIRDKLEYVSCTLAQWGKEEFEI